MLKKQRGEASLILIILVIVGLIGLVAWAVMSNKATPALESQRSGAFNVEKLFTNEGCTIFRFEDAGHYRYYSRCDMAVSSSVISEFSQSCGKGCTKTVPDELSTSYTIRLPEENTPNPNRPVPPRE